MLDKIVLLSIKAVGSLSLMADYLGVYSLLRWAKRDKTLILMYHGISRENITSLENFDGKHVYKGLFERQISYLKKHYRIISLDEYANCRRNNKKPPKNSLVMTFDDGYRNNFTVLFQSIKKYGVPVTIFLPPGQIEKKEAPWQGIAAFCIANTRKTSMISDAVGSRQRYDLSNDKAKLSSLIRIKMALRQMSGTERQSAVRRLTEESGVKPKRMDDESCLMSWSEVNKLKNESGRYVSFGSHTLTHPVLPLLPAGGIGRELKHSREIIEKRFGGNICHFSYPYGEYNEQVVDMTKSSGYSSAVTTDYGYNDKNTDLFRLKRICVSNNNGMGLFMLSLFIDIGKISTGISRLYIGLKHCLR